MGVFTFFELRKWYQIAQRIKYSSWGSENRCNCNKMRFERYPESNILYFMTPVRFADHISFTESKEFSFFCATRQIDGKRVADRAVRLWPNIKKIIS